MAEETPKKLVDSATVVEAITTVEWSKEQKKKISELGIYRTNKSNLFHLKIENIGVYEFPEAERTLLLENIKIKGDESLQIESLYERKIDIVINKSDINKIEFDYCRTSKEDTNYVYVLNSKIGDINIKRCDLNLNFWISGKSEIGFIDVRKNSKTISFHIDESKIKALFTLEKSKLDSIHLGQNSLIGPIIIEDQSELHHLSISNGCKVEEVSVIDSIINYLVVRNKCLIGKVEISNVRNRTTSFTNNCIVGYISIEKFETSKFEIDHCQSGQLELDGSTITYCNIKDSQVIIMYLKDCKSGVYNIKDSVISFSFFRVSIIQCKVENCEIPQLHFQNQCEIEMYISEGQIDHLNFKQLTLSKNAIISFSTVRLFLCNMYEFIVLGNLYFRNISSASNTIKFSSLNQSRPKYILWSDKDYNRKPNENNTTWESYFQKLKNYNKHIKELKSILGENRTATFKIVKSSLAKAEFTECDLKSFNFEYKNSRIIDIYINGGELPNKVEIYEEEQLPKILDQQKSFFNQLKKIFENQGDIVRSTFYRAKAAEIQTKVSWLEKNYWEWLVYKINEISNSHGVSWLRAFGFTLGLSLIGFIFYNAAFEPRKYEFVYSFNLDWIGHWAYFILPIHKVNFMGEPTSKALFIDVLFRILIGFGIYQFISAFRKHGKR